MTTHVGTASAMRLVDYIAAAAFHAQQLPDFRFLAGATHRAR